jgi:hypothetical protein
VAAGYFLLTIVMHIVNVAAHVCVSQEAEKIRYQEEKQLEEQRAQVGG